MTTIKLSQLETFLRGLDSASELEGDTQEYFDPQTGLTYFIDYEQDDVCYFGTRTKDNEEQLLLMVALDQ